MLPDVALLEMFHFYVDEEDIADKEAWCDLVHVCRKWRNVVFGSPRRLNLRLYCRCGTPVRKTLDALPLWPIEVWYCDHEESDVEDVIAVLEHNNRIRNLGFKITTIPIPGLERVLAAMQQPFPEMTSLELYWYKTNEIPVQSDSFLGGSAPRLRSLALCSVPFPGLPRLLLSATHLTQIYLSNIPHSGYISPETMATCLSALTSLESLWFEFESPQSCPDRKRRRPPPRTRALLPVLTSLHFEGVSEYLEDFVARIDAPLLDRLKISFFLQLIFDTRQLTQFVSRTPKLKVHNEAHIEFDDRAVWVTPPLTSYGGISLGIRCRKSDWQLSSVAQLYRSFFDQSLIPAPVEQLYIRLDTTLYTDGTWVMNWPDDIESNQWLELLHQFPTVKGLYISRRCEPHIAPALQELVGGRVTEVLPALETIFLKNTGPVTEAIERFVAARQLTSHPIALSSWK